MTTVLKEGKVEAKGYPQGAGSYQKSSKKLILQLKSDSTLAFLDSGKVDGNIALNCYTEIAPDAKKKKFSIVLSADNTVTVDPDDDVQGWVDAIIASKPEGYFGVELSSLGPDVPELITTSLKRIEKNIDIEGIFRISGPKSEIDAIKRQYDLGERPNLMNYDLHTVTGVFKTFLRELPTPVISYSLYNQFLGIARAENFVSSAKTLIQELPEINRAVLKLILNFLYKVAQHSNENHMTYSNLAIVFGPNILRPPGDDTLMLTQDATPMNIVFTHLIEHASELFVGSSSNLRASMQFPAGGLPVMPAGGIPLPFGAPRASQSTTLQHSSASSAQPSTNSHTGGPIHPLPPIPSNTGPVHPHPPSNLMTAQSMPLQHIERPSPATASPQQLPAGLKQGGVKLPAMGPSSLSGSMPGGGPKKGMLTASGPKQSSLTASLPPPTSDLPPPVMSLPPPITVLPDIPSDTHGKQPLGKSPSGSSITTGVSAGSESSEDPNSSDSAMSEEAAQWKVYEEDGRKYYHNEVTDVTQWEKPECLKKRVKRHVRKSTTGKDSTPTTPVQSATPATAAETVSTSDRITSSSSSAGQLGTSKKRFDRPVSQSIAVPMNLPPPINTPLPSITGTSSQDRIKTLEERVKMLEERSAQMAQTIKQQSEFIEKIKIFIKFE